MPEGRIFRRQLGLVALLLAPAASLPAELAWDTHRIEHALRPLQSELEVTFAYRNAGTRRVAIKDLQTNCECLEARASRTTVEPGESGILSARFVVGERIGRHERIVTVVTDDGAPPRRLVLQVDVPAAATFDPATLVWERGAEMRPLSSILQVAAGLDLRFAKAEPTSDAFVAELSEEEAGRRYRLSVRPRSTAAPANAAIRLTGLTPDGTEVVVSTYADVR